jgi:phosphoglycerate dehydrogenase-like enzyme
MKRRECSVVVASRSFSKNPVLRQELQSVFQRVTFNDDGLSFSGDTLVGFLKGHEYAILGLEKIDRRIASQLSGGLRGISKFGVGLDAIDQEALKMEGIALVSTPGSNSRSVAELVVVLALSLLRRVNELSAEVRSGLWRQQQGRCLSGRSVGIIGFGHVGKEVALLLQGFGCAIRAYDVAPTSGQLSLPGTESVDLDLLLRESEIVTLHIPLTPTTRGLLSKDRLSLMPRGALLINTARGGLVDEHALYTLLIEKHLGGAAFDVFESEPPGEHPLLQLPNFLATPHIGGSTEEATLAMGRAAIKGLLDLTAQC